MSQNLTKQELATVEAPARALAASMEHGSALSQSPIVQMMQAITDKGITQENVAALTQLTALYERMQDKDAERQFAAAFVRLQADLPVIVASTVIPQRGRYERFEDVMDQIQPHLTQHGFTVTFSQDFRENRILQVCRLQHVGGHFKENSFAVRSGKADTETQADCKAATTAKRNALCNALNIVIRQDALQDEEGDARMEGEPVTERQANHLRELVADTQSDDAKFLKYAGAKTYEEINAASYDRLVEMLKKKIK